MLPPVVSEGAKRVIEDRRRAAVGRLKQMKIDVKRDAVLQRSLCTV
jgi:hypothetical protein